MASAITDYLHESTERVGQGWNRFWFTPTEPTTFAALRIGAGVMSFYYVATFSFDLLRLFGPRGMLPIEVVQGWLGGKPLSLLNYAETAGELWAIHVISLVVLAMFTIGLFTRVTSVLALVAVLSYINRAPLLADIFEPILAMVLVYVTLGSVFLSGSRTACSVDRWWARRKAKSRPAAAAQLASPIKSLAATVSVRLVQVHLALIYLMMGVSKVAEPATMVEGGPWWRGEAVWWLIARPDTRLVDLTGLHDNILILNAWTHAIVLFELLFALLIWNRTARPLLLVLAVPMWLSLALITGQIPFCLMMLIANLAFVSPELLGACCGRLATENGASQASAKE